MVALVVGGEYAGMVEVTALGWREVILKVGAGSVPWELVLWSLSSDEQRILAERWNGWQQEFGVIVDGSDTATGRKIGMEYLTCAAPIMPHPRQDLSCTPCISSPHA